MKESQKISIWGILILTIGIVESNIGFTRWNSNNLERILKEGAKDKNTEVKVETRTAHMHRMIKELNSPIDIDQPFNHDEFLRESFLLLNLLDSNIELLVL